ncbi:MAG: 7TM domain-containing protein [bacterium]
MENSWELTYRLEFEVEEPLAQIYIGFPLDTADFRVYHKNVRRKTSPSPEARLKTASLDQSPANCDRELKITASHEGQYRIVAAFVIHGNHQEKLAGHEPTIKLNPEEQSRYLAREPGIQVKGKEVVATCNKLCSESLGETELVNRFFEHCHCRIGKGAADSAEEALSTGSAGGLGKARVFVALCRASGIPARLIRGLELKETYNASAHFWAEAFVDGKWKPFDPENGYQEQMPHQYVTVRRSRLPITRGSGVGDFRERISIAEIRPLTGLHSAKLWPDRNFHVAEILNLRRLPVELHSTLAVLLLFPLAALITAFFRTTVGVDTVGSFTPALLALSFVHTGWHISMLLLALVLVIGLSGRALLDRMKLLLLPRLSIILTLVVLGMILGVSIIEQFAVTSTSGLVLLPMVIMTMLVERFYVANEEEGTGYSVQLIAGTLVVAFFCYLILNWQAAGQVLLSYPELHFFTMAALIMLGSYRGYRLMEVWRFRDLR